MQTLLLQEAARRASNVSFIHTLPEVVKGGIQRKPEGVRLAILIAVGLLFEPLMQTPPDECSERHLMVATSATFPPAKDKTIDQGVPILNDLVLARGVDGNNSSGVYSIDNKCGVSTVKVEKVLAQYRADGTAQKVLEFVESTGRELTGVDGARGMQGERTLGVCKL
jgi:hypothetical protein